MQEIYNTGWSIMLIATIVLAIAHIGFNKDSVKFTFPKNSLPLTLLTGIFFWIPIYLFNQEMDLLVLIIPYVIGIFLALMLQSMNPKAETFMALVGFLVYLLIYKLAPDNILFILGLLTIGIVSGIVLRLLRAEKFLGNLMVTASAVLPLYAGFMWINSIHLDEAEISKRIFIMLVVSIIALAYAFSLSFLKDDKKGLKRFGALIVTTLVIYLILNNILTLSVNYIYFIVAGFGFAQILEAICSKPNDKVKMLTFEALTGLGLVLLVGFVATRLFGVWGLILLSLCCLATAPVNSEKLINWSAIAAVFFSTKAIVHIFIEQTTLNVTGLNLNHPYVYVGLIIGLTIPVLLITLTAIYSDRFIGFNFLTLFIFGLVAPLMASYLIHSEASGAMILGMSVSALIAGTAGKVMGKELDNKLLRITSNAALPLAALMGIVLILTSNLIQVGNLASRESRAIGFVSVALVLIIFTVSLYRVEDHYPEEFYPEQTG